jgi:hypothetical protein
MKDIIKVAGVTFTNQDGISRQSILREFGENCFITVNLIKQSFFNEDTRQSELAIACIEKNTKKQIGFIPREDITSDIMNIRQMTGHVGCYAPSDTYYCELSQVQAPPTEMYADMKTVCEKRKLTMPAYDVRAFIQFTDRLEANMLQAAATAGA